MDSNPEESFGHPYARKSETQGRSQGFLHQGCSQQHEIGVVVAVKKFLQRATDLVESK